MSASAATYLKAGGEIMSGVIGGGALAQWRKKDNNEKNQLMKEMAAPICKTNGGISVALAAAAAWHQ
jgi:hypothetical protein